MKIGLLRHFRVDVPSPGKCNSREYDELCRQYDFGDIIPYGLDLSGNGYRVCYASSLKRAKDTAELVTGNNHLNIPVILSDDLKEIPLRAIFKTPVRLPFKWWNVINRLAWYCNSTRADETRNQSNERAKRFLETLIASHRQDVLIVSHGLFMVSLEIQLGKMGFKGQTFSRARFNHLYQFEEIEN